MEIKLKHFLLFFGFFVAAKVVFFYLTPAEWGDSYRFIRAGEYLSRFSYPLDEKRLPFFPLILSVAFFIRVDPVWWGRFLVLILSILCLILTFKLGVVFFKNPKAGFMGMLLTAFSPVFFYWTGKIYAEALFATLTLLTFLVFFEYKGKYKNFLLGIFCGLSFMTRFEGFLLLLAVFLGFLAGKKLKEAMPFLGSFILISAPYFIFRFLSSGNFSSSYFLEPSQFPFNLEAVLYFLASLVFLFGFIPFIGFSSIKKIVDKKKVFFHLPIFVFVGLEVMLAFIWQAAIPRLFVPIIPFVALGLVQIVSTAPKISFKDALLYVIMWGLFLFGRFYLRLPFLVIGKGVAIPLFLSVFYVLLLFFRRKSYLYLLVFAGVFSSLFIAYFFKSVYKTVYQASMFVQALEEGKIAYSDESGVTAWYLRGVKGVFYDGDFSNAGEYKWLLDNNIFYIIDTNEHNEGSKLEVFRDENYKNKFEVVRKFKARVGTAETSSTVYKVIK